MQSWAIGDVHGCGKTLDKLVQRLALSQGDEIIFLGDVMDRGQGHQMVMNTISALQKNGIHLTILRGNHEQGFLDACKEAHLKDKKTWFGKTVVQRQATKLWMQWGGEAFLEEYGVQFPEELPSRWHDLAENSTFYLHHAHAYLVHAGFNFEEPDFLSDTHAMMWIREFSPNLDATGGKIIVHGHVPVHEELIRLTADAPPEQFGFIDIDNGAVYAGKPGMGQLVALELSSRKLIFQPCIDL
jgi:serine/threonine protein phosphatase 1